MKIVYAAGLLFMTSVGIGMLFNLFGLDERTVLGFILIAILMVGGTVAYGLNEIQLELEKIRTAKW